jgi:hypothetical protein
MAAAQGGAGAGGASPTGSPTSTPGQTSPADQEFFDNITKLLSILDKLSTMKPMGQDVSKYITAAAAPLKDMMTVFKQPGGGLPGQSATDGSVADSASAGAAAGPAAQAGPSMPDTGAS